MEVFATDLERLEFLLEAEAEFHLAAEAMSSTGEFQEESPSVDAATKKDEEPDSEKAETGEERTGGQSEEQGELPPEKRPKYITNYIGSKQKLVDWIWRNTPQDVKSALDAFSGSAVVAYMFKSKGLRVVANDRLHYCHHAARAIIENGKERLSAEDIDKLLAGNGRAGSFARDHFKGLFFASGVHGLIDQIRANCDKFSGYKKDIALFALGKTCMSAHGGFGHFSASSKHGRQDSPEEFKERLRKNVERINALVFDNGQDCKAHREETHELLPRMQADLVYFDPPYATEFSTTNYEKSYHFVEGLMIYWKGLKIKTDTQVKSYETTHETVTKANAEAFFERFLSAAKHIGHWLISYRDHAYPNEDQMKKIIGSLGRESRMKTKDHQYSITARHGEASNAKERLFVCKRAAGAKAEERAAPLQAAANFHTTIPVEISFREQAALSADAMQAGPDGDPQFSFILCRTGTNRNGDHFLPEELAARHATAINRKIDLQHSQDFSDIVGGIVASDYLEDETGGRVECVGELYVRESEQARLAHKLMRKGIISQVSMECDYEEGECSICGKRVKSKNEYCPHLRKMKGGESGGKPVFEILHGVTFTGLGLLDRKGADENARIIQVASANKESITNQPEGGPAMDDKKKPDEQPAEGAKKPGNPGADQGGGGSGDQSKRIAELEQENKELKAKVAELQKRVQELESEQQAAAHKARATKLIARLEKQGVDFGGDEERDKEFQRLSGLSDDAFAATEAAYERMARQAKADSKTEDKTTEKPEAKKESAKASEEPMRSDAGVRPRDVDDRKATLEDQLRDGFMAAYESRVGEPALAGE
ncbi:DNA adenine methylase [bacterium]|nr:DNA adenine methylase [bacterium]